MSNNNIWEIESLNKLGKLLLDNKKKFVILCLTLEDSPQEIRKMLVKFMKTMSKQFKLLTFALYTVKHRELQLFDLFKKTKPENYPYVFHIFDTDKIFITIELADEISIYEIFNYDDIKQNYLVDYQLVKSPTLDITQNQHNQSQNNQSTQQINQQVNKSTQQVNQQQNNQTTQQVNQQQNNQTIQQQINNQDNEKNEKELMERKLQILENKKKQMIIDLYKKKSNDFDTHFLRDIKKRKEEEIRLNHK